MGKVIEYVIWNTDGEDTYQSPMGKVIANNGIHGFAHRHVSIPYGKGNRSYRESERGRVDEYQSPMGKVIVNRYRHHPHRSDFVSIPYGKGNRVLRRGTERSAIVYQSPMGKVIGKKERKNS